MGDRSSIFSMCGMCAVRCPIRVEVGDGEVKWIEGNAHVPAVAGALCAKGSAGISFMNDTERPQSPMLRVGPRGSGQWRKITWEEALDHVADKLKAISGKYGAKAIAIADRGGVFNDLTASFIKALGSPNYLDHDDSCAKNVDMACQSVFGYGRNDLAYDFANARHIVLYGRNVFESLQVSEVNNILDALDAGAKLTYIDIRATVTASKADKFLMIRPGTDYALNLALIHVILKEHLYDAEFVDKWVAGLSELESFAAAYPPEWAEKETGIPAHEIANLARVVSMDRPSVVFHGGWMLARYTDSFYSSRSIYILNALMGNFEASGGLILAKGADEVGAKPLRSIGANIPDAQDKIFDAEMPGKPLGTGHIRNLYKAIDTGAPYPVKAFFAYRYDPIAALPDPDEQKKILDKLELLVSIDVNYSQTGWYSDLILPEASYLERSNILATLKGMKPSFAIRRQAVPPKFDTKPAWEIFTLIVDRMGAGRYFPFKSIEDIWNYQLEGTGVKIADFDETGFVSLSREPVLMKRNALKFNTPSGKIEFVSQWMKQNSFASFAQYVRPKTPENGRFRLAFGRPAFHTHAQTQNNIYLNELASENELWINKEAADNLGIINGAMVKIGSPGYDGKIRAKVTPYIHPEAVFMLHGFGNQIPLKTRSFNKGLSDSRLEKGLLDAIDPVGGGIAFLECMVSVRKA